MSTPLHCPLCGAEFDFAAWSRAASCPQCGRRVRFEDAAAAPAPPPAAPPPVAQPAPVAQPVPSPIVPPQPAPVPPQPGVVPPPPSAATLAPATGAPPPAPQPLAVPAPQPLPPAAMMGAAVTAAPVLGPRTLFGKPLAWSLGWTIVVVVWALVATGLAAVRLDMGHLTVLSSRERSAIATVQHGDLQPGVTYSQALTAVVKRFGAPGEQARWYVQDRPWEKRVYVLWELDGQAQLTWMVADDGRVTASADTTLFLKEVWKIRGSPQTPQVPQVHL